MEFFLGNLEQFATIDDSDGLELLIQTNLMSAEEAGMYFFTIELHDDRPLNSMVTVYTIQLEIMLENPYGIVGDAVDASAETPEK